MERIEYVDHKSYLIRPKMNVIKQNIITEIGIQGFLIG